MTRDIIYSKNKIEFHYITLSRIRPNVIIVGHVEKFNKSGTRWVYWFIDKEADYESDKYGCRGKKEFPRNKAEALMNLAADADLYVRSLRLDQSK
jgi:hypothetical protein